MLLWFGYAPACAGLVFVVLFEQPRERYIPAGTGTTSAGHGMPAAKTEYPRVYGEDFGFCRSLMPNIGTPPHTRGQLSSLCMCATTLGNSPACTGTTVNNPFTPSKL